MLIKILLVISIIVQTLATAYALQGLIPQTLEG